MGWERPHTLSITIAADLEVARTALIVESAIKERNIHYSLGSRVWGSVLSSRTPTTAATTVTSGHALQVTRLHLWRVVLCLQDVLISLTFAHSLTVPRGDFLILTTAKPWETIYSNFVGLAVAKVQSCSTAEPSSGWHMGSHSQGWGRSEKEKEEGNAIHK